MSKSPNVELRKVWEQRIDDHKSSGQTQAKWCDENGISVYQFSYWKKRIKDQHIGKENNSWVQVVVEDSNPAQHESSLLIKVGSVSIEVNSGFNTSLLKEVIKVLKEDVE
ncbi:IS66 family insertion sequence element accessory protein TnpB [Bacillus sp. DNRA2]|uniref:IS66 family insertion sequence element accessory protein TnpA n=1 Tax=Bacillus sp. DNRA2 TaxID=2723053 RepID=UPI00145FBE97|nr:IS66 family insertion sequence element accessory protein TnpB [Bacillus sp. DNRA2]NMD72857.1 IS66 family insertion sequence element accessory protein TnpB [Bacillus sp. DNRA2]